MSISPLSLLESSPPVSKMSWTTLVKTKITAWHERHLRGRADENSKMRYLNIQISYQSLSDFRRLSYTPPLKADMVFFVVHGADTPDYVLSAYY